MKRLIVCCDGTWNSPEQETNGIPAPTNVFKIYNAVAEPDDGIKQLKYYHPGLGSEGGIFESVVDGALGKSIGRHIKSAYHWLGQNFEKDDEIYLFGFSRGAFTARSIGGLLGRGLLDLRGLDPKEAWLRVDKAYAAYQRPGSKLTNRKWCKDNWTFFHGKRRTPVRFVGVWETVGALGVPDDLELLNLLDNRKKWEFHNTSLGTHMKTARHAMAIDEIRSSFSITRWANAKGHPDVREKWFPGVHTDVGGGYPESDLSDGALKWIIEESEAVGLEFRKGIENELAPNPLGVSHDSYKGFFSKLRSRPRNIPAMGQGNENDFHDSAIERQRASPISYPPYHPTKILAERDIHTVEVFADTRWNHTGLYLEKDHSYVFSAVGEWQDSKDTCDWKGTEDGKFTAGDLVRAGSSFLGKFEAPYKRLTGNNSTDFLMTKRVEKLKWFTLVGAITNDSDKKNAVENDGSPTLHQYVALAEHESVPLKITSPGYLYCFPNDVWSLYENNHGSIHLTITRVR
ncbi:MAG: DUF2235 domain-containing protein [Alphaproteobacteria bacterium]|nr:DUF2235 domain-containing protein [Alphaproteobacteria bacterium]